VAVAAKLITLELCRAH